MLLIIEIIMLIAGVMMLANGALPPKLTNLLFGRGEHAATPSEIQKIGIAFILPLPLAFAIGFIVGIIFQSTAVTIAVSLIELAMILGIYFWSKAILKNSEQKIKSDFVEES